MTSLKELENGVESGEKKSCKKRLMGSMIGDGEAPRQAPNFLNECAMLVISCRCDISRVQFNEPGHFHVFNRMQWRVRTDLDILIICSWIQWCHVKTNKGLPGLGNIKFDQKPALFSSEHTRIISPFPSETSSDIWQENIDIPTNVNKRIALEEDSHI